MSRRSNGALARKPARGRRIWPSVPRPRLAGLTGFIAFALASAFGIASVPSPAAAALPRPAHVVVVIEENKSLAEILGNANAPYINELFAKGALFTQSHGVTHPSLPNYSRSSPA